MAENTPIISFKDADILNGEATVIYGLNMDVYPGDFVYIVGKVGTGKTSIIRTIIAENDLEKGYGSACGFELNGIAEKQIPFLRRQMGVVFQNFELLIQAFETKAVEFKDILKMGRTQLEDAVPMTLGQTFGAFASILRDEIRNINFAAEEFLTVKYSPVTGSIRTPSGYSLQICSVSNL